MTKGYSESVNIARDYYNSDAADTFYATVWGGEDLHLGIYESQSESIFDASRRTVDRMAAHCTVLTENARVLDLGAGFGGTARHLARKHGCHVTALNLSEKENERNRRMTREQCLDHLVDVVDGSFQTLPFEAGSFDVVWSQDALLHSDDRIQVLREAHRVLRAGGEMVFTDPMQADDCPPGVLDPILERIHLETLASPGYYRRTAEALGMTVVGTEDQTSNLTLHYSRVLQETQRRYDELTRLISREYLDRMLTGLKRWIDGGRQGYLAWSIFCFRKPQA
ncbi:MAG: methyltransferase domain-containing protein [Thermoleophilia bacterium]|nr:methyltransferase domain-containing protein [Thermoleophilia bacterium]